MVVRLKAALKSVREQRSLAYGLILLLFVVLMLSTPRIRQPQSYHKFADQRNLIGVPNSLNVMSNFPFLIIGVIGLVLCIHGNYLGLSLKGEQWGWAFFYIGVTATAFGSAYYHLKPDDSRLVWDRLPMAVSFASLMAVFIIERIDERKGATLLVPLLLAGIISVMHWRLTDDMRLYALAQLVTCISIPLMTIALPSRYTHSLFWLWATGFFVLAKVEEAMDKKIYRWTNHGVSGHTLKHIFAAIVPVVTTIMLARRNVKIERQSLWERWKIQLCQEVKPSFFQLKPFKDKSTSLQDETERLVQA